MDLEDNKTQEEKDVFTSNFGKLVWEALNDPTRDYKTIIPRKVVWGKTVGWRHKIEEGKWIPYEYD